MTQAHRIYILLHSFWSQSYPLPHHSMQLLQERLYYILWWGVIEQPVGGNNVTTPILCRITYGSPLIYASYIADENRMKARRHSKQKNGRGVRSRMHYCLWIHHLPPLL